MLKFSKKLMAVISAAALLSSAVVLTSCKDEDENNALDGYSISYGHPSDATVSYSRSWNVTHTNHLSADCTITIDRTSTTTKGTTGLKTTTDGGNNAAYIFGLTGSGTAEKPYSFGLIGFRLNGATPQYFISYYTGVQAAYCNSDVNDFDADDAANTAYEYILVSAWTNLPDNTYTLTSDALSVYVDLDALSGSTAVTKDNYSTLKDSMDGYQIKLFASSTATTAGVTKTLKTTALTKDTYSNKTAPAPTLTVEQARLGFYAMVSKGKALVAKLDFNNDSIVKSVVSGPTDDFGKPIDLYGEVLTNIK